MLVLMALLAAGCSDDKDDGDVKAQGTTTTTAGGGSTTTTAGSGDSTTTTGGAAACPANTTKQSAGPVSTRAQLTDVRAAHQPGFDRIVFEFTGAAPGFDVEYVSKPVHEDGSGEEVPLRGQFALSVRMENASGYDMNTGRATYNGPTRIRPSDTTVVEEVVQTGDFEGVLNWHIGTKSKAGFRVRQLANPPRLQVEVCAAP